jgi:type I restriction enzyme R subunit
MLNEADTRIKLIDPKLQASGWTANAIIREKEIAKGMIINANGDRIPSRKPDYILYYPDISGVAIAVIEAKSEDKSALEGMQQSKDYMERLAVPFAYSTNGHVFEEYDDLERRQVTLSSFPSPEELWRRYVDRKELKELGLNKENNPLLYPFYPFPDKPIRYYQEAAVKTAIESILKAEKEGRARKVLLTMATGSGKTYAAFQLVWKLYKTKKIRRVLYLVDRVFLRRQAHDYFFPFGNAREELEGADDIPKHKDIFFVTYQTLYSEKNGHRVFELFEPDFFDLVIIDECHRSGWARWHDILKYFSKAIHVGLTATPKRDDNIDTYDYFGQPAYDYPMRVGIEDGYLAPCEVLKVFTNIDKKGIISMTEVRSEGAKIEVPEGVKLRDYYTVEQFEREITLPDRTRKICEHLSEVLESTGPKGKSAVFCVSQSHAAEVTKELNNHFGPMFGISDYAVRVVADEPYAHASLKVFANSEKDFPVVVTTVDLLSTGVDIPPMKNIVFLKPIDSKVVFHQIIGRGTRVDEISHKFSFRIIDYTDATRLFDSWDLPEEPKAPGGPCDWYLSCNVIDAETGKGIGNASLMALLGPSKPITAITNSQGSILLKDAPRNTVKVDVTAGGYKRKETKVPTFPAPDKAVTISLEREAREKKSLVRAENVEVYIAEEGIVKANVLGNELQEAEYVEYCKDGLIKRVATLKDLEDIWIYRDKRLEFKQDLKKKGIDLNVLSKIIKKSGCDEFDLIAHILFKAPVVTRDERAQALIGMKKEFFKKYGPNAQDVLFELVDRYRIAGIEEVSDPKIFRTPPFNKMGALRGVVEMFGGVDKLKEAIRQIETGLYPELEVKK